jgi:ribosomal protein L37AE/L43A
MNIKDLKRQESPEPPKHGERQFDAADHLCEACGKWATLLYLEDGSGHWVCAKCFKDPMRPGE